MSKRKRFTKQDVSNNQFYQMPKFLFEGEFKSLTSDARVLYSLLRDRHSLSLVNGWVNEYGEVYLIYTRGNMANMVGCSLPTVRKAVALLQNFDLIEDVRQGLNKPNLIYLKSVDVENTRTERNLLSREKDISYQEAKNVSQSKTDTNKINLNNTNNLHFLKDTENEYVIEYLRIMNSSGYTHKRVSEENLTFILGIIETLVLEDIGIDNWIDTVEGYFDNLPKDNDGDILAFLKGCKRHFGVDLD